MDEEQDKTQEKKPDTNIKDLEPEKDAKGGGGFSPQGPGKGTQGGGKSIQGGTGVEGGEKLNQ